VVQRFDHFVVVVRGVVDSRRYLVGGQVVVRVGLAEFLASVGPGREPLGFGVSRQDDGHPVVDRLYQVVRLGRQDRHAGDRFSLAVLGRVVLAVLTLVRFGSGPFPEFPEAGHRERRVVGSVDPVGLFRAAVGRSPLVEARREDETRPGLPGALEDALLVGGLRAGVDDPRFGFVDPERDDSPVVAVDLVGRLVRDDFETGARWDVVPRCVPSVGDDLGVEPRFEVPPVDEERVSSAHTAEFAAGGLQTALGRDESGFSVAARSTAMAEHGRYRVLPGPEPDTLLLLDRETYEPAVVSTGGSDDESGETGTDEERDDTVGNSDTVPPVAALRPGYLVDAALDWSTQRPTVESVSVVRPTLFVFADRVDPMFEAARETWEAARSEGEAMNTQVLRNTDNEVTGVVYVFAESGDRGRFEEFREGARPLEPLLDRVADSRGEDPREVFVLRSPGGAFTAVAITLRKGGHLADTMRDTYDCPRPDEPLADAD